MIAKVEWRSWVFFNDWSLPRKWTLYSQCRWRDDDSEPIQVSVVRFDFGLQMKSFRAFIVGITSVTVSVDRVLYCSSISSDIFYGLVIYIDQPIGTGFSFGTDTVNSTQSASPFVWQAFQILFESQAFSKYSTRE